jgi:HlyD family secretion protein
LRRKISQTRSNIRGHEAQIVVQEIREQSSNLSIEEQLRLVNILIKQSQRNLKKAREDFTRIESLYKRGGVAKVELDDTRATMEQNESTFEALKQGLAVISAGKASDSIANYSRALSEAEQINIEQLEKDVENCRVTADADGIITMLYARGTNFVTPSSPVAEISVLDGSAIEVFVSTQDIGGVKMGDTVALILKRRDGDIRFTGRVDHMAANAEIKVSALGLEERRVKVKISPNLSGMNGAAFGVGYDVDVRFILYSEENKLAVPKTALFKDNGKDMLWVIRDGRAQAAEVTTGMELRTEFVIESGLAEGDAIVTNADNDVLKNGLKVVDTGKL